MFISERRTMRGPNFWSVNHHKLIVLKLDLKDFIKPDQHQIQQLNEAIALLNDQLQSKYRVRTSLPQLTADDLSVCQLIASMAIALQQAAGSSCRYTDVSFESKNGIYPVVYAYEAEETGRQAADAAMNVFKTLLDNQTPSLKEAIDLLNKTFLNEMPGPSTKSIIDEAAKRDIPVKRLDDGSLFMLGHGVNQKLVCATLSSFTNGIAIDIAGDKDATKKLLSDNYIPVPKGVTIDSSEQLISVVEELGFPLAIKPLNGNHGRGITTDIRSIEKAKEAYARASLISEKVIIEEHIQGRDYRFLVINYKLVAVARRTPPYVIGDNISTIKQLIEQLNDDPLRGDEHEKVLTKVKIDHAMINSLAEKDKTLDSVLPFGEILYLKDTANLSSGGTARDVTDRVHPDNVFLAERVARLLSLDICGIDVVATDINMPIAKLKGAVIEVNAAPGFRMHLSPTKGLSRNVAEPVVDMLFPDEAEGRIPIVAITGTNGKTTTTRLIAHLARSAGHSVGYCTTEGVYINKNLILAGDCSGPSSAALVLRDPIVDFAVLECARGGLIRSGLAFDKCDTGIITNISEDHLGIDGIDTLEELAKVKQVVAKTVKEDGYAILNADDDHVFNMKDELDCNIALFSLYADNPRIIAHCEEGGTACFISKGYFELRKGQWSSRIAKVCDVPLTQDGKATCMIQNVMPAILAATTNGISATRISKGLMSFIPSPSTTPGRMNIFNFPHCKLMIDYAHNEGGFVELKKYLDNIQAPNKIGVVAAVGDRRDEDIRKVGFYAASMFDQVILRHDKDGRGRSNDELTELVTQGIQQVKAGVEPIVISDETEAIKHALDIAQPGSFIVYCADKVFEIIDFVQELLSKYNGSNISLVNSEKKAV